MFYSTITFTFSFGLVSQKTFEKTATERNNSPNSYSFTRVLLERTHMHERTLL